MDLPVDIIDSEMFEYLAINNQRQFCWESRYILGEKILRGTYALRAVDGRCVLWSFYTNYKNYGVKSFANIVEIA